MSKSALDTFTKYSSQSLAKKGIRINNINPGAFITNIGSRGDPVFDEKEIEALQKINNIPVGRMGVSEEIASIYLQLADDKISSFVTGACWIVDGGTVEYAPCIAP